MAAEHVVARPDSQRLERVTRKARSLHDDMLFPAQEASIPRECNGKALGENLALSRFFIAESFIAPTDSMRQ
jgi:hypothetical protein